MKKDDIISSRDYVFYIYLMYYNPYNFKFKRRLLLLLNNNNYNNHINNSISRR